MIDDPDNADGILTFILEGEVSLDSFAEALAAFNKLVTGLSREAGGNIKWELEDLTYSSAVTVVKGKSPEPESVAKVVRDYVDVGRALQQNQPIRRSAPISRPANTIRKVFRQSPSIKAVRFETDSSEAILTRYNVRATTQEARQSLLIPEVLPLLTASSIGAIGVADDYIAAYGAVEGLVQTLTNRRGHRFTLYDSINDRAVSCYLEKGYEKIMRDAWGKRAIVEGWVSRDPSNGNPITVRQIISVTILEEGDYTQARGILPLHASDISPEETIRRLRDD